MKTTEEYWNKYVGIDASVDRVSEMSKEEFLQAFGWREKEILELIDEMPNKDDIYIQVLRSQIESKVTVQLRGQFSSFSDEQIETIKKQVRGWDLTYSVLRAIEELGELTVALTYLCRKPGDRQHEVLAEMADVRIALKHLEIVFGNCQDFINKKVGKDE